MAITNKKLSFLLHSNMPRESNFIDKIKIGYRPYICPFSNLLEIIPENTSVFDIGCGSGMFLALISGFRKPAKLGGVEITDALIENAKKILANPSASIFLDVFDGINIPKEIADYKYVFLIDVLHHVPQNNQIEFIENIYHNMAPGAFLILKDIDAEHKILSKFNKLHDFFLSGAMGNELSITQTKKILNKAGFKIISENYKRMFIYPHFTLICQK